MPASAWGRAKQLMGAGACKALVEYTDSRLPGTRVLGFRVAANTGKNLFEGIEALQKLSAVSDVHDDLVAALRQVVHGARTGRAPDWNFLLTTLAKAEQATE